MLPPFFYENRDMRQIIAIALMLFSVSALAGEGETSKLNLLSFRGYQVSMFQSSGGNSFSGGLGWTPTYQLLPSLAVKAKVNGLLLTKNEGMFVAAEGVAGVEYAVTDAIGVEAGGGGSYWVSNGGFAPLLNGGASYKLAQPLFGLVNHFFADYSYILASNKTHEIKAGVGFSF